MLLIEDDPHVLETLAELLEFEGYCVYTTHDAVSVLEVLTMARESAKEQLVEFFEQRAFQPVLRAKESSVPQGKQDELDDLQDRTTAEIQRLHNYRSAEDVVTNFRRDLHSSNRRRFRRD